MIRIMKMDMTSTLGSFDDENGTSNNAWSKGRLR